MADITQLVLSYPDFVLGQIIDPAQFDQNNTEIVAKINEVVTLANTHTASIVAVDTLADTAITTANTADANADAAVITADTADGKADNAVTTANTADANASTAVSTANTAKTTADGVKAEYDALKPTLEQAVADANAAVESVAEKVDKSYVDGLAADFVLGTIPDASLTAAKLAFDVATQAELDTVSGNITSLAGVGRTTETVKGNADNLITHQTEKATDSTLGHIKKGSRINVDGNGVTSVDVTDIPLKTTADITLYIRTDGNDGNDGSANDADHALLTITAAIAKIPQIVNHNVTINVAAGTYAETVNIKGYVGTGRLYVIGDSTVSDSRVVNNFEVQKCGIYIYVQGFKTNYTTNHSILATACACVQFSYCKSIETSGHSAFCASASNAIIDNSLLSNHSNGVYALNARIFSNTNSGTGNTNGLAASNASTIGKNGTQPGGTTAESATTGGVIR